jgi:hypothetical protein
MCIGRDRPAKRDGSRIGLQKETNIAPNADGKGLDRVANDTRQKIDRPDQQAIDSVGLVNVAKISRYRAFAFGPGFAHASFSLLLLLLISRRTCNFHDKFAGGVVRQRDGRSCMTT